MRFLTFLLLVAAFACKSKPSEKDMTWKDLPGDPIEGMDTASAANTAIQFTDTVLVSIGPKDFVAVTKLKRNMPILDLRNEKMYKIGHIWRSTHMDADDPEFMKKLSALSRTQEYAVYCQFGDKSFKVAEEMKRMGFMRIYHLQKGLTNWKEAETALQLN